MNEDKSDTRTASQYDNMCSTCSVRLSNIEQRAAEAETGCVTTAAFSVRQTSGANKTLSSFCVKSFLIFTNKRRLMRSGEESVCGQSDKWLH